MSRFVAWQRPYNVKRLEDIFTKRYVPLYPKLFNVAVAILGNDSNEAADAVQEAMVKIWQEFGLYRKRGGICFDSASHHCNRFAA